MKCLLCRNREQQQSEEDEDEDEEMNVSPQSVFIADKIKRLSLNVLMNNNND